MKAKYNKSLILKFAWKTFRNQGINTSEQFGVCLKLAWSYAKTNPVVLESFDATALYVKYHNEILTYINFKTKNLVVSQELADDVFLKAIRYQNKFDSTKCKIRTWLYTIAKNTMLDYFRKQKQNREKFVRVSDFTDEDGSEMVQLFVTKTDASNEIESNDFSNQIKSIFDKLTNKNKQIATLYFLDNMKYMEIAEVLDIPMNTVKVTISRCREKLQKNMVTLKKEYMLV